MATAKIVQHLKGGTVTKILIKEGDLVKGGQPLLLLDDVQIKAQIGIVDVQLLSEMAVDARLQAEREGRGGVVFPKKLLMRKDAEALQAMELQRQLFTTRTEALKTDERAQKETIAALESQIRGFTAQGEKPDQPKFDSSKRSTRVWCHLLSKASFQKIA